MIECSGPCQESQCCKAPLRVHFTMRFALSNSAFYTS